MGDDEGFGPRLLQLLYRSVVLGAVGAVGFLFYLLKTKLPQKLPVKPSGAEEKEEPKNLAEPQVIQTAKILATEAVAKSQEILAKAEESEEEEEEEEDNDDFSAPRHRQIIREVTVKTSSTADPLKDAARQVVSSAIQRQQHQAS